MKNKYGIICLLCCLLSSLTANAQSIGSRVYFEYEVKGKKQGGSFDVKFVHKTEDAAPKTFSGSEAELELACPSANCQLVVDFFNLKWDNPDRKNKNEVRLYISDYQGFKGLQLTSSNAASPYFTLKNDVNRKLKFAILGEAQGSFKVKAKVKAAKGGEVAASQKNNDVLLRSYYKISVNTPQIVAEINDDLANTFSEDTPPQTLTEATIVESSNQELIHNEIEEVEETPLPKNSKKSEAELWKEAQQKNTIKAYRAYINRYSRGKHTKDAWNKMDQLHWEAAQKKLKQNPKLHAQIIVYENYLAQAPNGGFRDEAKNKIDDVLWQIAQEKNNPQYYLNEIWKRKNRGRSTQYKGGFNAKYAQSIPIQSEHSRTENVYNIRFINVVPKLKITAYDEQNLDIQSNQNSTIVVEVLDNRQSYLSIEDALGRNYTHKIDNSTTAIAGDLNFDAANQQLSFSNLSGGTPPYHIQLRNEEYTSKQMNIGNTPKAQIHLSELGKIPNGNYQVFLTDANKQEQYDFAQQNIQVKINKISGDNKFSIGLVGAVLLGILGLLGLVGWQNRQSRQRQSKVAQRIQEKQSENNTLKITKKKENKSINVAPVLSVKNPNEFYPLNLTKTWKDTLVKKLYLHHDAVIAIDSFIRNQTNQKMQAEIDVPEIGGFLLGSYKQNTDYHDVWIEKFVPITPEQSGVYSIEFGSQAWAELADIQEQNEHLNLIGWFHTHPGHGLFLSRPDLKIQNGFFKENFQIAMEVDPLTDDMDTSFFTRNSTGEMNNKKDKWSNAAWFRWTDIDKWSRTYQRKKEVKLK